MSLWFEARHTRHIAAFAGALALSFTACSKPVQVTQDEAMVQGTASVQVTGHALLQLDLEGPAGAVALERPALRVDVRVQNNGDVPMRWDPGFSAVGATQAQNVLLFAATSWESGLSPANNIAVLDTGAYTYLDDPVREPVEIAPGEAIDDVLLFAAPASSANNLILSIPPRVFGPEIKLPGYISIPYTAAAPAERTIAGLKEAAETGALTFTVSAADVVHQPLKNAEGTDVISRDPLLRIRFTVKNTSDKAIEYIPTRMASGIDFPALTDQNGALQNRATFAVGVEPVGQIRERQSIAPGKSVTDFILFDRPTRGVETLHLTYPGKRLGGTGLVRAEFPYTWANPDLPEEFKPKQ